MNPKISEHLREEFEDKYYETMWSFLLRLVIEYLFTVERKTVPQIAKILRYEISYLDS